MNKKPIKKENNPKKKKIVKKQVPKTGAVMGRPRAIGQKELEKLEFAFSIGCSVLEALVHSGVEKSTYYDYLRDNPNFSDRIEILREKMPLKARIVVDTALGEGDVNTAKWLLERNKRAEFSTQQNVDHTTKGEKIEPNNLLMAVSEDELKQIESILTKYEQKEE
jgi:hypothetical protein